MTAELTPFGLAGLLTGISSLGMGFFVLLKSHDRKVARIWFVFSLAVACWGFSSLGLSLARNAREAFWLAQLSFGCGGLWIPVLFQQFMCAFLDLDRKKWIIANYLIGLLFLASLFSHHFLNHIEFLWNSIYFMRGGNLLFLLCIWWTSVVSHTFYLMARAFRSESPARQNQIKYFFWAMLFSFGGGSLEWLPYFGVDLYPWGNFTVCLYPVIMAWAILQHQLLDVNVVIRKTLLYSTVTAVLTAVYVVISLGLARALSGWVASPTAFSSAIAACAMALLFHPMRMKIQNFVDRHFFRETMDQNILREATSGFVHEIKRPLTNISLPAELSLRDLEDLAAGQRSIREVVDKVSQRLRYILDQTSDAADKIEAIRETSLPRMQTKDELTLIEIIRKSVAAERPLLERYHVRLIMELAEDLPGIRGRKKQLEIVFSNLIKNAAEAMRDMPAGNSREVTIHARLEPKAGVIVVLVADTGPGIKPENLNHLFEPYFTTKGLHGMGMGLFLCRQIVQSHGGAITVSLRSPSGSEFSVSLPINK